MEPPKNMRNKKMGIAQCDLYLFCSALLLLCF